MISTMPPLIGITCDTQNNTADSGTYQSAIRYSRAVAGAGGLPVLLPHELDLVDHYAARCQGFIFTGGDDPDVRRFGHPLHSQSRLIDPRRQAFESALLQRLSPPDVRTPCLGVCLGMQMMALDAGGRLNQFLPETLGEEAATIHQGDRLHPLRFVVDDSVLRPSEGQVVSSHRQAVVDAGHLRVVATAPDGIVEAVDDPHKPFYLGVQWHPERGDQGALSQALIAALVGAARAAMS